MLNVRPTERLGQLKRGARFLVIWLIRCLLLLLVATLLFVAVGSLAAAALYLGYLATRGTVFDTWAVLSIISALLSVTAIAGAGLALWRRKLTLALAFAVLAVPAPFVIEGSRCDTAQACRVMGWAALPATAFRWQVRLRPVTDPNEARWIASAALSKAGSSGSPFKPKRFADHWIVPAINEDGWPNAYAVRIDTRSAKARLVAYPADKVQCGMERPTLSDGRSAFRNDRLGLAAIFPASRAVCTSRGDDDEPRGFFSMLRAPDIPCEIIDDSRQMGVEVARYRIDGCAVLEAPSTPWRPLSSETAKLFQTATPSLGGEPSVACELRERGHIQISVYALVDVHSNPGRPPGTLYEGYIVTTSIHLAEDIQSFETFLEGVRIDSPARKPTD